MMENAGAGSAIAKPESSIEGHFREDTLGRFFALALAVHIAAVALFALSSFILGLDIFSSEEDRKTEIIQSAVRVDVVAMPKLTVQELKAMQPQAPAADPVEQAPEKAAAKSESEVEFKTEKKVKLSSLLSSLSNRKIPESKKKKKKGPAMSAKDLESLVMEGNKVSKGQALVGDSLSAAQGEFADYVAAIPGHIRPFWKLPSYLMEKDLRARIQVYISENGKIIKTRIYQSSGVSEFDKRALSALEQAGALPVPAKSIVSRLSAGEVVLGFPL